jgi:hypothetical protein
MGHARLPETTTNPNLNAAAGVTGSGLVIVPRAEAAHRDQAEHQNQHGQNDPLLPVELPSVPGHEIDKSHNLIRHNCFHKPARQMKIQFAKQP